MTESNNQYTNPVHLYDPYHDGYNWKMYGKKNIKQEFPRFYYKCAHPNCLARKKVDILVDEIAIHYDQNHNHQPPSNNPYQPPNNSNMQEIIVSESTQPTPQPLQETIDVESHSKNKRYIFIIY